MIHAIVVGLGSYGPDSNSKRLFPLTGARTAAIEFCELLLKISPQDIRLTLLTTGASETNRRNDLREQDFTTQVFQKFLTFGNYENLVLFWSGHGYIRPDRPDEYLLFVPSDVSLAEISVTNLGEHLLNLEEEKRLLNQRLIIDSCAHGLSNELSVRPEKHSFFVNNEGYPKREQHCLFAARKWQGNLSEDGSGVSRFARAFFSQLKNLDPFLSEKKMEVFAADVERNLQQLCLDNETLPNQHIFYAMRGPGYSRLTFPRNESVSSVVATFDLASLTFKDYQLFEGRTSEVSKLSKSLRSPGPQVIAITGSPAIGKSALACYLANIHRDQFPGGIVGHIFSENGGPRDAEAIYQAFAESMNTDVDSAEVSTRLKMQRLFANSPALLIFDGVMDASDVRSLLPGGTCKVIITTQSQAIPMALNVPEEHRVHLRRYPRSDAIKLMSRYLSPKEIDREMNHVVAVLDYVDNLPLAIHIIGVQVSAGILTMEEFSSLLEEEEKRLETVSLPGDELANLRSLLNISFSRLGDTVELLRAASVCAAEGFSLRLISSIRSVTANSALRDLQKLQLASLIEATPSVKGRFRFAHGLIHLYAKQSVADSEAQRYRQAHSRSMLELLNDLKNVPVVTSQALALDITNLELTAEHLIETIGDKMPFWVEPWGHRKWKVTYLLGLVGRALRDNGRPRYATRVFEHALGRQMGVSDRAALLNSFGSSLLADGEYRRAVQSLEESVSLWRDTNNQRGEQQALTTLARAHHAAGNLESSLAVFEDASKLNSSRSDNPFILLEAGRALIKKRDYEKAIRFLKRAEAAERKSGNPRGLSMVLIELSVACNASGDAAGAIAHAEEAVRLEKETGNHRGHEIALHRLGILLSANRKEDLAIETFEEMFELGVRFGHPKQVAIAANSLGLLLAKSENLDRADCLLRKSFEIGKDLQNDSHVDCVQQSMAKLAKLHWRKGNKEKAIEAVKYVYGADRAEQVLERIAREGKFAIFSPEDIVKAELENAKECRNRGDSEGVVRAIRRLIKNVVKLEQLDEILLRLDEAFDIMRSTGERQIGEQLVAAARLLQHAGHFAYAAQFATQALVVCTGGSSAVGDAVPSLTELQLSRNPQLMRTSLLTVIECRFEMGRPKDAREIISLGYEYLTALGDTKLEMSYSQSVGKILVEQSYLEDAIQAGERTLQLRRKEGLACELFLNRLGSLSLSIGNVTLAMQYFESAVNAINENTQEKHAVAIFKNLARVLRHTARREQAVTAMRRALAAVKNWGQPSEVRIVLKTIQFDLRQDAQYLEALEICKDWLDWCKNCDQVCNPLNNIGTLLNDIAQPDLSMQVYQLSAVAFPDVRANVFAPIGIAMALRQLGRLDDALASLVETTRQIPTNESAREFVSNIEALVLAELGRPTEAANVLSAVTSHDASRIAQFYRLRSLGRIKMAFGHWFEASAIFHDAMAIVEDLNRTKDQIQVMMYLAQCSFFEGKLTQAIAIARSAYRTAESLGDGWVVSEAGALLARYLRQKSRDAEATEVEEKAKIAREVSERKIDPVSLSAVIDAAKNAVRRIASK
jgi:tetratricopeptide (TPR) repeat protein